MPLWGRSQTSDITDRIADLQAGLGMLASALGAGAEAAGDSAARGLKHTGTSLAATADNVAEQLGPLLDAVQSLTARFGRSAGNSSVQAYRAVEEKVEDNAMIAVIAALGVGILIGSLGATSLTRPSPPPRAPAKAPARAPARKRKNGR